MQRHELAREIHRAAHLRGRFTLRSGQTSEEYFDKFQFTSRPELLDAVSAHLAMLLPPDVGIVAGLQLGGVPLAAALALKTGRPAVYVRLERKAYGTARIAEGVDVDGARVAVVEDVVTTGGQILSSVADLRAEGADVRWVLAVVDREQGARAGLADHGLDFRPLFTSSELERAAAR